MVIIRGANNRWTVRQLDMAMILILVVAGASAGVLHQGHCSLLCIDAPVYHFGVSAEGTTLRHTFVVRNLQPWPLTIVNAAAPCGCTATTVEPRPPVCLLPFQTARIHVTWNTAGESGDIGKSVRVWVNDRRHYVTFAIDADITQRGVARAAKIRTEVRIAAAVKR